MPSFKEHFNIPQNQIVEFLDIPLDEDLLAFICPFLIANNRQVPIFNNIFSQLKAFFVKLNRDFIVPNDAHNGLAFLSHLHEPNEYHLGYSGANKGRAISDERSVQIFGALRNNRFARQGIQITNEAHNVLLLVKGIGQDIMSDTIANVCRNIFADFTLNQCVQHNIPTIPVHFHYYDAAAAQWGTADFDLPDYRGKPIILIPKDIISPSRSYPSGYNNFVAGKYISPAILNGQKQVNNPAIFINTLANGRRRAIIKAIRKEFGKKKEDLVDFVVEYNGSLDSFVDYAKEHYPALDLSGI
ncbi:hypothetical protein [Mucilaginibacter sp. OK283]|uniref:hypothetical protein n=1 Tax=Mucilaginibacter sp. OK283 TaxID=1881049 RepID=UPI0008CE72D5|nr:hypothetical protein [Mucilaginibacter sp. OK283]SEO09640.1 hypothetical protein SAMN05428947_101285 [Mucilaginibacter sp. OK283]